jgi:hypothetical protein
MKNCADCFNVDNEIRIAEFSLVIGKNQGENYEQLYQHLCRHHTVVTLDLFLHESSGITGVIQVSRINQ